MLNCKKWKTIIEVWRDTNKCCEALWCPLSAKQVAIVISFIIIKIRRKVSHLNTVKSNRAIAYPKWANDSFAHLGYAIAIDGRFDVTSIRPPIYSHLLRSIYGDSRIEKTKFLETIYPDYLKFVISPCTQNSKKPRYMRFVIWTRHCN